MPLSKTFLTAKGSILSLARSISYSSSCIIRNKGYNPAYLQLQNIQTAKISWNSEKLAKSVLLRGYSTKRGGKDSKTQEIHEDLSYKEDEIEDIQEKEKLSDYDDTNEIVKKPSTIIYDVLNASKPKNKYGRQAQTGKIRRKPIPLYISDSSTTYNSTKEKPYISTEQTNSETPIFKEEDEDAKDKGDNDKPPRSDKSDSGDHSDHLISAQFTLPIIHFSNSKRVHALPALALFRKPAFPGFYQVLQVQDQAVIKCLSNVKQNSGHDYVGGFLTKTERPNDVNNSNNLPMLRDDAGSVSSCDEMHVYGTLLQIITITPNLSFQGGQVILMPHKRIKMTGIHAEPSELNPLYRVAVEYVEDTPKHFEDSSVTKALHLEIIATVKELIKTSHFYKEHFDQIIRFYNLDYPTRLADLIAGISLAKRDQLQNILAELNIDKRLTMVLEIAKNDLEFARVQNEVNTQLEEKLSKDQRKYILTEQMKMIKKELGMDSDDKSNVIDQFESEFEKVKMHMSDEAISSFNSGISRLKHLESSSAEFGVWRSYLEWLVGLPWGKTTEESKDIHRAKEILDSHHFGLNDVKTRLLEFMATTILNGQTSGKIICLIGPPGVGKTSIAMAMAESLNRKLYRFSLGGLFDIAEIKGHRRTYVGSLPGKFVQALKYTNTLNPLIILDEIDKLGRDTRGDPASALLEALDPSQNMNFRDFYLDIPVDLSQVLFVCTANSSDTIPTPLLDRMELITIPGYLPEEKLLISKNFLIPQTQKNTGLSPKVIDIQDSAIECIIKQYSREAGVRNLLKCIEKIHRKVALDLVMKHTKTTNSEASDSSSQSTDSSETSSDPSHDEKLNPNQVEDVKSALENISKCTVVKSEDVQSYLGVPIYTKETLHPYPLPYGVVLGLAWTNAGGATMYVEAHGQMLDKKGNLIEPDRTPAKDLLGSTDTKEPADTTGLEALKGGSLKVTGHLGTVMTESSQIALTYCKTFIRKHQPNNIFLDEANIHIHVPEGATPKDGPSGGITMASALISIAAKKRIKPSIAMTGELTISGKVLRVGGIKEKLIAAIREDISTVIMPVGNKPDFEELDASIKDKLSIIFVDTFDDVYHHAFE
uniref:endopeptidase La n=1 Tax=Theileria annulata TaxID=5874 RepID=A0A3B0MNW2_THEAN